jgi:hypothetical protein
MRMMLVLYFCRWAASRCSLSRPCGADYATIIRQKDGVLFFAEAYITRPTSSNMSRLCRFPLKIARRHQSRRAIALPSKLPFGVVA